MHCYENQRSDTVYLLEPPPLLNQGQPFQMSLELDKTSTMMALVMLLFALSLMDLQQISAFKKIVDLSHVYNNKTLPWPSEKSERFRFTKREKYSSPHYEANSFAMAEHGGTHVDAPRHFVAGGYGIEKIPLSKLIGYAVVVNVTEKASSNRDLLVGKAEFNEHETKFGKIPDDSIVLLYSGGFTEKVLLSFLYYFIQSPVRMCCNFRIGPDRLERISIITRQNETTSYQTETFIVQ